MLELLSEWVKQPRIQAMTPEARLDAAMVEFGLHDKPCPACEGRGCRACDDVGHIIGIAIRTAA